MTKDEVLGHISVLLARHLTAERVYTPRIRSQSFIGEEFVQSDCTFGTGNPQTGFQQPHTEWNLVTFCASFCRAFKPCTGGSSSVWGYSSVPFQPPIRTTNSGQNCRQLRRHLYMYMGRCPKWVVFAAVTQPGGRVDRDPTAPPTVPSAVCTMRIILK